MFTVKDKIQRQDASAAVAKNWDKHPGGMQQADRSLDSLHLLQRNLGNGYLQAIGESEIQGHGDQQNLRAKLVVGSAGDVYEQEADRVADQVMHMPAPQIQRACPRCDEVETVQPKPLAKPITPLVQRQVEPEEGEKEEELVQTQLASDKLVQRQEETPAEEEEESVQTKSTGEMTVQRQEAEPEEEEEEPIQTKPVPGRSPVVTPAVQAQINALRGGGQPLPSSVRIFFEPRFGCDFSQVRIHTDNRATETAYALNARAYTIGQDVVFGAGQYEPATATGKRVLAHELGHVVQQRGGETMAQCQWAMEGAPKAKIDVSIVLSDEDILFVEAHGYASRVIRVYNQNDAATKLKNLGTPIRKLYVVGHRAGPGLLNFTQEGGWPYIKVSTGASASWGRVS